MGTKRLLQVEASLALTLLVLTLHPQRAQDGDALPGQPREGAPAERTGGSALQAAAAAGAAH